MPLKHSTETTLVVVLGIAMILTGIVLGVLSLLASPWMLWIAAFFVSLAYPLILYPHFRDRRADYEFRLLHFTPAIALLLWLALTLLARMVPVFAVVRAALTVAWALPLVAVLFALLAWFCLHVIRQWPRRVGSLVALIVPFAILGILGNRFDWNRQIAAVIDRPPSVSGVASSASSSSRSSRRVAVLGPSSGVVVAMGGASSASSSIKPPLLPHAGGGLELFAVVVPAATCAAAQVRAMRRKAA